MSDTVLSGEPAAPPAGDNTPAPEGGADTPFHQTLPEAYRDNPTFESYKDMDGLLKSHVELNKMLGKPRVDLPQDNWKEEDYDKFYSKLGRPDSPEGYAEGLETPEGVELDADRVKWASELLHKHGISGKAGKEIIQEYINQQIEADQQAQASQAMSVEEATKELKEAWGDNYDTRLQLVRGVAEKFGGEKFKEALQNPAIGNNTAFLEFLYEVSQEFAEDVATGAPGAPMVSKQAQARMQIDAMKADESKFRLLTAPMHSLDEREKVMAKNLRAQQKDLYDVAYPG